MKCTELCKIMASVTDVSVTVVKVTVHLMIRVMKAKSLHLCACSF